MTRAKASSPSGLAPQPCFCGCGGIALYGAPGAHYLIGHAPSERAPARVSPPKQAGAVAPPQGDLFGASPGDRWRPARKRLTS